jgi:hypothetical protein
MTAPAKRDPAVTIEAADRLLETTENPLHRQILENYRRRAILDISGDWEVIFDPDMTVEEPLYTSTSPAWTAWLWRAQSHSGRSTERWR